MRVILSDYKYCIGYFGKSCADSILRQVKKLSYTEDNCPKVGERIDMGGFYVEVMEIRGNDIIVMMDQVKR